MNPHDDRIAMRRAEIAAQQAELDRETAAADVPVPDPGPVVADRREGSALRSAVFLIGVLLLAAGLFGVAVTLSRLAGQDIADAERTGQAQVTSCVRHGPISNKGFGTWYSCVATITWDSGGQDRLTAGAVFTPADIGKNVRVGDMGDYRITKEIARADASPRPWLGWIGYAVGVIALLPAIIGVLLLREVLRFRRR
jgi:hypothetical protein